MRQINKKQFVFILLFAFLGFIALQIPVARLVGSRATFTLFDALAPTAGAFLGSLSGVMAVFLMQIFNFVIHDAQVQDIGMLIRFVPPLAATLYFAKSRKFNIVIPLLAIVAFNLHPIGRSVWYYSLYWLIPVFTHFFHGRSLLARSFGATFTAHAVGGALWIYFFNLPKSVWINLIPVVALERTVFALGMALGYVLLTNIIYFLAQKRFPGINQFRIDQKYVWKRTAAAAS